MRKTLGGVPLFAVMTLLLCARAAAAQTATYITGTAYADIKRFGSSGGIIYYYPSEGFSLDSTAAGGGLRVGTFLHPKWSLELSIDADATSSSSAPNPYALAIAIYPPPPLPDFKASTRFLTVSTTIGFHPASQRRVKFGYFAGFSFVRTTSTSDFDGILPLATVDAAAILPVATFPRPVTLTSNSSGAVLGLESAIDLTNRIALVPELRALTFSLRGDGIFLIRPGVGFRVRF